MWVCIQNTADEILLLFHSNDFFPSFKTANNIEKKDRERDNLSMHLFSMNMFLYFMKLKEFFFFENAFYVVVDITRRYFFALSFSFPSTAWLLFSQTPVEEGSNNKNKVSHITWLRVKDFFFYSRDRAHKYKRRKKICRNVHWEWSHLNF